MDVLADAPDIGAIRNALGVLRDGLHEAVRRRNLERRIERLEHLISLAERHPPGSNARRAAQVAIRNWGELAADLDAGLYRGRAPRRRQVAVERP